MVVFKSAHLAATRRTSGAILGELRMVEQKTSSLEVYIYHLKILNAKLFEDLEMEVTSQGINDLSICLCGDFNARTLEICDYISEDNNPLDHVDVSNINNVTNQLTGFN